MFKDEEKRKVGRPRLAEDDIIEKSKRMIFMSITVCLVLGYFFFSSLNGKSPIDTFYSLSFEKVFGQLNNKDGFLVSSYYDDNLDFVVVLKPSDTVKSYQGNYFYETYYLKDNKWIKKEEKEIYRNKDSFKIKFESKKNKNVAWKIKLQIKNGSQITKSFAPHSWVYVDSDKQEEKYAYKVITVKGYYSPVSEKNSKDDNKLKIYTNKNDERNFILDLVNTKYSCTVSYNDASKKIIVLKDYKNILGKSNYKVPNLKVTTTVNFKVYVDNVNEKKELEKYKPSTWKIKKDKNGNYYITNNYVLKPHQIY